MSQRSTAQHYHTDTPFCTIRKSHVTWNFAVPGPHSEEMRRCILLFLCTLDTCYYKWMLIRKRSFNHTHQPRGEKVKMQIRCSFWWRARNVTTMIRKKKKEYVVVWNPDIGLASDHVKLVLNNNSVPGYGHTHVHKDWKILCRTQALLRDWSLLRQALLWASVDQRDFFYCLV